MKISINQYLNKPAHFYSHPWLVTFINVLVTLCVLGIFQPFGYKLDSISQIKVLMGYALIVFIVSLLFFKILPSMFKKHFQKDKWTNLKNIIFTLLFIVVTAASIFIYDYNYLEGIAWGDVSNSKFPFFIKMDFLAVMSISIFPLIINYLMEVNYNLKVNLVEAKQMNRKLKIQMQQDNFCLNQIRLTGETKESLLISPDQILYIESEGNYVNIHYILDGPASKMLRTTLKEMESQLKGFQYIFRCHRAFIVNADQIGNIHGTATGYLLDMRGCDRSIPVSRTYKDRIREYLK